MDEDRWLWAFVAFVVGLLCGVALAGAVAYLLITWATADRPNEFDSGPWGWQARRSELAGSDH